MFAKLMQQEIVWDEPNEWTRETLPDPDDDSSV